MFTRIRNFFRSLFYIGHSRDYITEGLTPSVPTAKSMAVLALVREFSPSTIEDASAQLSQLNNKLFVLSKSYNRMVAANSAIMLNDLDELSRLGYSSAQISELTTPNKWGEVGFSSLLLRTARGSIERTQKRIQVLSNA